MLPVFISLLEVSEAFSSSCRMEILNFNKGRMLV